jgi:hypothetical protein
MYQPTFKQLFSFVLGHFGLGLIAVTEHDLVEFFCSRLAVDKHLEAPSCIVLVACRSFDTSIEGDVLEKIKVSRIRLYVFLKLRR